MEGPYANASSTEYTSFLPNSNNRRPFSMVHNLFLPNVCLALVSCLRSRPLVRLAYTVVYCIYLLAGLNLTTGHAIHNYSMGSAIISHIATAIHFLWLTDPVRDFRHEKDAVDPASLSILKRWYWVLRSVNTARGVGWNYQVAHVPPASHRPRWQFVFRQFRRAIWFYLLVDLAQTYIQSNPFFTSPKPDTSPFTSQGYVFRCVNIVAWMTLPYGTMNMNYSCLSVICVALGISEPKYWPNLFGAWSDSYTVRRFWGRTWHQLMRRYLSSIGKYFVQLLGFKKGTNGSSYTQLYVGFIISGLVHVGGDTMVGREWCGSSFLFFLSQAVAISFEDAVIAISKSAGLKNRCPRALANLLGYTWVFLWFSLSTAWYIEWAVVAGFVKSRVLNFSAIETIQRAFRQT